MTPPTLVIGNKNYSSWSLRAWLAARHTGIPFEEVRVALYQPGSKQVLHRYSPAGKVPVYIDRDTTVWDSLAICEYLAERDPSLWPADIAARATARSLSAEMHSGFTALRDAMPMNCRACNRHIKRSDGVERDISRIVDIWTTVRTEHDADGPWLFGAFSIADVMFAPVASRFKTYAVALRGPALAYQQTVLAHPDMRLWYADAAREPEILSDFEVGA